MAWRMALPLGESTERPRACSKCDAGYHAACGILYDVLKFYLFQVLEVEAVGV